MRREDLTQLIDEINQARSKLMIGKGHDYANEDVLANFKRMCCLCEILDIDPRRSSADCASFLLMLKIDRWHNLRSKGAAPSNESVKDTILDLHNYVDLDYACELAEGFDAKPLKEGT